MTTQYGFIDSGRCTGCKTCNWPAVTNLTPDVGFRRAFIVCGWRLAEEDNGVWHQNVFAYLSHFMQPLRRPACAKSLSGAMHKRDDGLWW